jgi:hypothetical protein
MAAMKQPDRVVETMRRTRCNGNKDHEERSLGVSVADGRGNGGKPLLGIAVELILDDLLIMQRNADD